MRKPLAKNTVLKLQNTDRTYMIDNVLGVGAISIVYSACWEDSFGLSHPVRIKELCPAKAETDRNDDGNLTWNTDSERDAALQHFEGEYEKHQLLSSWQDTINSTVQYQESLLYGNGTAYMIMGTDNGKPYSEVADANLHELFKTLLALAKAVALYHEKGMLLLDIKPENFLVLPETRELVKLFDFDSVVPERKVMEQDTPISYSYDYAAPELRLGKRKSICRATDYYAIGAIAFSRIMNRFPEADDCLRFSDWDFSDNSLFSSTSPKSKRLIKAFFHRTLASHANARYSSDQELIGALQPIVDETVPGRCFLYSAKRAPLASFIGREQELGKIHAAFTGGANIVFLRGLGGIGKTELAKAYGKRFENEYDTVCFGTFKTDTDALLRDQGFISFANVPAEAASAEDNLRRLSLTDPHTLLIVDDYSFSEDDSLFENLLSLPCRVLITTREQTKDLFANEQTIQHFTLGSLQQNEQWNLFTTGYHGFLTEEEKQGIEKLFAAVDGHTMFIDLFAKNLQATGLPVLEAVSGFEKDGLSEISEAKIRSMKDGIKADTIEGYFRTLFDISNLSDDAKRALSCLALLGGIHIDKRFLCKLSGNNLDALNLELINRGWVRCVEELDEVSSHEILMHSVYMSLNLSLNDLPSLEKYFDQVQFDVLHTHNTDIPDWDWRIHEDFGRVHIEQQNLINELRLLMSLYRSFSKSSDLTYYTYAIKHHTEIGRHIAMEQLGDYFDYILDYDDIARYFENPLVNQLPAEAYVKLNALFVFHTLHSCGIVYGEDNDGKHKLYTKAAIDALNRIKQTITESDLSELDVWEMSDYVLYPCAEAEENGAWLYENVKVELNRFIDEIHPSFYLRFDVMDSDVESSEEVSTDYEVPQESEVKEVVENNKQDPSDEYFDLLNEACDTPEMAVLAEKIYHDDALSLYDKIRLLERFSDFYYLNQRDYPSFGFEGSPKDPDKEVYANTAVRFSEILERLLEEFRGNDDYWSDWLELAQYNCLVQKTFAHAVLGLEQVFQAEMDEILLNTVTCHIMEIKRQSTLVEKSKIAKHFALLHGLYQFGKFKDCLDNSTLLIKSYEEAEDIPAVEELYGIYNIARKSAKRLHLIDLEVYFQNKIKAILNTDFYYTDYLTEI